ncbi:MAG: hypothetical protein ACLVCH_11650 [Roseburia inulinivorans]
MGKEFKRQRSTRNGFKSKKRLGRYQARFTSVNGKRKEKNFDKITEARNWLTEAKYKDSLLNNCNMTVDEWFDFWLNNYKEGIVANNTKKVIPIVTRIAPKNI